MQKLLSPYGFLLSGYLHILHPLQRNKPLVVHIKAQSVIKGLYPSCGLLTRINMDHVIAMLQLDPTNHLYQYVHRILFVINILKLYVTLYKNLQKTMIPNSNMFGPSMECVILSQLYNTHTIILHPQRMLLLSQIIQQSL